MTSTHPTPMGRAESCLMRCDLFLLAHSVCVVSCLSPAAPSRGLLNETDSEHRYNKDWRGHCLAPKVSMECLVAGVCVCVCVAGGGIYCLIYFVSVAGLAMSGERGHGQEISCACGLGGTGWPGWLVPGNLGLTWVLLPSSLCVPSMCALSLIP